MNNNSLRELAIKKTGSLTALGKITGHQKSTICKYFNGQRRPDVPVMRKMARALGTDFMEVVEAFYGSDSNVLNCRRNNTAS